MKTKPNAIQSVAKVIVALTRNHVLTVASAAVLASGSVQAANINKADNSDALNLTTSWTGSVVPTASDVAVWDSTVTSNNTTNTLGASTSWAGIQLLNPATALTVITNTGGNTLTLGAAGIDMSSATVDLTMSNNVTLAASTVQSWNVPSGRTLSLQGAFARPTGTLLSVNGSGTINIGAGTASSALQYILYNSTDAGALDGSKNVTGYSSAIGYTANTVGTVPGQNSTIYYDLVNSATGTGGNNGSGDDIYLNGNILFPPIVRFNQPQANRNYWYINVRNGQQSFPGGSVNTYLITTNVGACDVIVSGASHAFRWSASSGTGAEFIVDQENTAGSLFVNGFMSVKAALASNLLTKRGAGRAVFNATLVHSGLTRIMEGELMINGGSVNGAPFLIKSGATLSGSSLVWGPVTNNGTIWPGNTNGLGYMIVNNLILNSGSSLKFYSPTVPTTNTSALLNVTNVTVNGAVNVAIQSGAIAVGQYPLIHATNAFSGAAFANFSLASMPPHSSGYLSNNTASATIDLVVTNVSEPLKWAAGSGTWSVSGGNWVDATGTATTYQEVNGVNDSVLFEDTQSGSSPLTISINAALQPSSTTVSSSKNYTFSGTGGIGGPGGLTKSGTGALTLSTTNAYSGTTALNGGTTVFTALTNLGIGPIAFGGGTLQYNGNSDDISLRTVTFNMGGATIDTAGQTVTFANPVGNSGAGGLTKVGAGTLTLTGTNKYTGNTVIANGTLALAASTYISNSAAIIVNSGAILDSGSSGVGLTLAGGTGQMLAGVGAVSGSVINSNGVISPGTNGVVGTLTFSGDLSLAGGNLNFDLSTNSGQSDLVVVSGSLYIYGGSLNLNVTGTLTNGTYKLIQYGSFGSGAGSSATMSIIGYSQAGKSLTLSEATAGRINLVVADTASDNIVWSGAGSSWDTAGSLDWLNGATSWAYTNGDLVTFDENGIGQSTVNLQASLTPSLVVVSNQSATYTFADGTGVGGGKISGPTSIVKKGSGTLVIATANNNTGPTDLRNGTLQIGNSGTLGDLGSGNVTNNGALMFYQSDNHLVRGVISGAGSLTQQGGGTVTLTNNNTYSGFTYINSSGTLQVGAGGASGGLGSGAITNDGTLIYNRSGTLTVGNIKTGPANGGALTFSGPATVTLNNGNTYINNTAINNGVVKLASSDSIPSAATVSGSTGWVVLDGGATAAGTLDLNGHNIIINALQGLNNTVNGTVLNSVVGSTNTLAIIGTATTDFSGAIKDNAGSGGAVAVVVEGGANQTFNLQSLAGNSYSGGTVISNATVTLTSPYSGSTATYYNPVGLGAAPITLLSNGTIYAVGAYGQNVGPTWASLNNTINIPADQTGTIYGPQRGTMQANITGAGTLNYISAYVRDSISGDWSGFTGQIIFSGSPNGGQIGIAATNGFGRLLCTNAGNGSVTLYNTVAGTPTIPIGELADDGTAYIESTSSGNAGGVAANFQVGSLNTSATFGGGIVDNVGIIKVGTGSWTLTSSTLTYSGITTVRNGMLVLGPSVSLPNTATITLEAPGVLDVSASGTLSLADSTAQTLQGNGTLNGSLSAGSSATILPGGANAIGTLTITNAASLAGTIRMELNETNAVGGTNDQIAAASITYGGDLIVTNLGPALHTGDKFKLFSVAGTGSFNSITLPVSDHGYNYTWTTNLAVDGTIQVLAGAPNVITDPPPHLTNSFNATSGQLTLNWGAGYQGYRLQAQTNTLSTGLTTNWVDWAGSTNVTQEVIALDPTKGTVFFRLIYP